MLYGRKGSFLDFIRPDGSFFCVCRMGRWVVFLVFWALYGTIKALRNRLGAHLHTVTNTPYPPHYFQGCWGCQIFCTYSHLRAAIFNRRFPISAIRWDVIHTTPQRRAVEYSTRCAIVHPRFKTGAGIWLTLPVGPVAYFDREPPTIDEDGREGRSRLQEENEGYMSAGPLGRTHFRIPVYRPFLTDAINVRRFNSLAYASFLPYFPSLLNCTAQNLTKTHRPNIRIRFRTPPIPIWRKAKKYRILSRRKHMARKIRTAPESRARRKFSVLVKSTRGPIKPFDVPPDAISR